MARIALALGAIALGCISAGVLARSFDDPRAPRNAALDAADAAAPRDSGCAATQLVSAGAPFPKNPRTLAVRWTGVSNFELVYGGRVLMLDAYYDRGSIFPPLGVKAADIKKVDVVLLGHGHVDHMSDAASIGARTGATVVGAPVTTEKLATQPIPAKQVVTVTGKGGELLKFPGFTVEPILARHGEPSREVTQALEEGFNKVAPQMTAEQRAEQMEIASRGVNSPRVITEGTIGFLITLDDGFRIYYRDSAGQITDYERAAFARIGRVDLALLAVTNDFLVPPTVKMALDYMRLFKPDVVMPAHHDGAAYAGRVPIWRATEPLFQAMKDENPAIVTLSKEYREPVCFNTEFNIAHGY